MVVCKSTTPSKNEHICMYSRVAPCFLSNLIAKTSSKQKNLIVYLIPLL
jgi:hypothetical protein